MVGLPVIFQVFYETRFTPDLCGKRCGFDVKYLCLLEQYKQNNQMRNRNFRLSSLNEMDYLMILLNIKRLLTQSKLSTWAFKMIIKNDNT